VFGKDSAGSWQDGDDPTTYTWIVDATPPIAILSSAPRGTIGISSIDASVGGADVRFYEYSLDDAPWSSTLPAATKIGISDLEQGVHTLYVVGMDTAGNRQADINASTLQWTIDLDVPTAVIDNIPKRTTNTVISDIAVEGRECTAYKYSISGPAAYYDGTWSDETAIDSLIEFSVADDGSEDGVYTHCVNGANALPSIYYLEADGSLSIAGVEGERNSRTIYSGGTVLASRQGVPEDGYTTYTIGLLVDHMSTYVAVSDTGASGGDIPICLSIVFCSLAVILAVSRRRRHIPVKY